MSRASAENGMNRSITCKITESNMVQMRKLIPFQQCFFTLKHSSIDSNRGQGEAKYGQTQRRQFLIVSLYEYLRFLRDAEVRQVR